MWKASSTGLVQPDVTALVVNHISPSTVYLGAFFSSFGNSTGVYKSTDGGNTWTAANTGLSSTFVLSLAIDPITPSTLYAGVYGSGIFKSVDGGAHWAIQASQTVSFITGIAIDPITPTTLYVGCAISDGKVFKSTNGGVSWQEILSGNAAGRLAIDPATPSTIYASGDGGLYKSTDAGSSWTSKDTRPTAAMIIDPVTSNTLYAAFRGPSGGVFRSIDGGNNWIPADNGLTYELVASLILNPAAPSRLYAGVNVYPPDTDAFVTKVNPGGTAFVYSTLLGASRNEEGRAIAVDSSGNAYVAGFSESPDFPVTPNSFQPFNRGFSDAFISKLTMSYTISGYVLDGAVPVSGAEITLSDGGSLSSSVTDSDGAYRFSHLSEGGSYTVAAAKPHFAMTPPSQSFNNLHGDQLANFAATPTNSPFYAITGHITENAVALSGVAVTLSGSQQGITTTDSNGLYAFTVAGGSYTVSPSLLGFTFAPAGQTFNNLSGDQTADFAAMRQNLVVTNAHDHGQGSLRQAILEANASVGLDMIVFNIPGSGVHTIDLLFHLPDITSPLVIDATTQPGYQGSPLIELNGAQAGAGAGFLITVGGSTVRGFVINRFSGPGIRLSGGGNNVIQGNYIGVDSTGTVARTNQTGISIFNSSNNLIGGTSSAARNVISGNGYDGVALDGSGNLIQGNFIGTNVSGSFAIPNGRNGIGLGNSGEATDNTVGGTAAGAGNLISGNQYGVYCYSSGNAIQGNLIGTNAAGTAAIANGTGISARAPNTRVGGTAPGARNIISGNGLGLAISGTESRLEGNFIGTDVTGMTALANTSGGVDAGGQALVGGVTPQARNVISGNGGWGNISLGFNLGGGDGATVQGNYVGTDVTGQFALANPSYGIIAFVSNNVIGGTTLGAGNVISGNTVGVQIGGSTTATLTGNLVQGNLIGLNATADAPLPNRSDGVNLDQASGNTIGGDGNAGNTIAFNARNGVFISSGTNNSILRNSIFSNGGLGIDISTSGVTANDPGDGDTGANNRQNFPLLTSAISNGSSTAIEGTLNSKPSTSFRIDFYSNAACDASGNGEGARHFDTTNVTTDANGNAAISFISPMTLSPGRVLSATATDPSGNTSEFSPCDSSNAIGSAQFSAASYNVLEDAGNAVITVTRAGGSKGQLSVDYRTADGSAIAGSDYTTVSGTLVFADGETSKTFSVPVVDDGVSEADETVQLTLLSPSGLESLATPATATLVIQDSSTALFLTINSIDVPEGDSGTTGVTLTVTLSGQTGKTITADYNTSAQSATSGTDFVAASGSLTFAAGVTTQTIGVSIIGDTLGEPAETFRVLLSNLVNASVGSSGLVRILDDDRPTISAVAISRQRGTPVSNSTIANVTDAHQPLNTLSVTVNGGATATANGVTISNISVSAAGVVTADVVASCTANGAGFTLTVTNNASNSATAILSVPAAFNDPPSVGNYPDANVPSGGTITVTPTFGISDNGSVTNLTAVAMPATFTGTLSVDPVSGGVTILGANPPGSYDVNVTLTDNCNAVATRIFTLNVNSCAANLSKSHQSYAATGGVGEFTLLSNPGCLWTATSNNPDWITVTSGVGTANGMVTYSVNSSSNASIRVGSITVSGQTFTIYQGIQFNDVPVGHAFYDEIGKLSARSVTLGCGNGSFCPNAVVTREQMAAFIVRALGEFYPSTPAQQRFEDVLPGTTFYNFIDRLAALQITLGVFGVSISLLPIKWCDARTDGGLLDPSAGGIQSTFAANSAV
jgi:hypothetical protein